MALQVYDREKLASRELAIREPENEEARAARLEEAEKLEKKLNFITENVPHRIQNIMGSNAGAGSGEFHMYRQARRREQLRLERIEEQDRQEEQRSQHEGRKRELQEQEEQRTSKRRAKRQKQKEKKQAVKRARTQGDVPPAGDGPQEDPEGDSKQPDPTALPDIGLD